MAINQFEIWIADLSPKIGTEPVKTRPVITVQTNLLNHIPHPSTIICPVTSRIKKGSDVLRVHIKKGSSSLHEDCDILIDQIRAIDNRRLIKRIGVLPPSLIDPLKENIKIVLDLD